MSELKALHIKRGSLKTKLTLFKKFIESIVVANLSPEKEDIYKTVLEITSRLDNIDSLLQEYDDVQLQIENISTNADEQLQEREEFENNYYAVTSQAKFLIQKFEEPSALVQQQNVTQNLTQTNKKKNIKLPTIQIPTYDGSYEKWLEYHDIFDSLIHKNADINDMEKFHYLKASLSGDAAKVISSLELSATNYSIAWQLICERYSNKKLLIHNHIRAIFCVQSVTRESSKQIRHLIDTVNSHIRALKALEQPTEQWDAILIYLICTKLDITTARKWESKKGKDEMPRFDELLEFLKERADLFEKIEVNEIKNPKQQNAKDVRSPFKQNSNNNATRIHKTLVASSKSVCIWCKGAHRIYYCQDFQKMPVKSRIEQVHKLQLCINCLNVGHHVETCRFGPCKNCNIKHHTLLHLDENKQLNSQNLNAQNANIQNNGNEVVLSNCNDSYTNQTLLSTVMLQIKCKNGQLHNCRALLDSASQSNYITAELCRFLNLKTQNINISIEGIGKINTSIKQKCSVTIRALHTAFTTSLTCLVINTICENLPNQSVNIETLAIPGNIRLADPSFAIPSKIDMLIGAGLFWQLLCIGQVTLGPGKPILHKTKLGWVVSGPLNFSRTRGETSVCYLAMSPNDESDQLSKFWAIEECPLDQPVRSREEQQCESHYVATFQRESDGHFIVSIPLKYPLSNLGDSRHTAIRQFYRLERKLHQNPTLLDMYTQFMREYIMLGHMTKMEDDVLLPNANQCGTVDYFMPHHGVLREGSLTTKLRVVFNASCPSSSGWSYNDCQLAGPTIQSDLFAILLRFRQYAYVLAADIEKMYRMVWVKTKERPLQKIVWREHPSESLSVYQLNTVTYGTTSAPFLAVRCLHQLATENAESFPEASSIIANSFYVDDLLVGDDNRQRLLQNCQKVSHILQQAGFNLRKWISNDSSLLNQLQSCDNSTSVLKFGPNENSKTLGVLWSSHSDSLVINTSPSQISTSSTKRSILSSIAQIFDPLGLLSPCIIIVKILIQKLWIERLTWDEAVSMDIHTRWTRFRGELSKLHQFEIPRHVRCKHPTQIQLHVFSDASQDAYGACLYIRSIDENSVISTNLLCAKSKVAPTKSLSIPRLELCGALVAARLSHKVINSLDYQIDQIYYWTDSTILLGWLKTEPILLKTFVANRISEIQSKTNPNSWHHVSTSQNSADLLSRGLYPGLLKDSTLWWHGPSWLSELHTTWPTLSSDTTTELPELKAQSSISLVCIPDSNTFEINKFSRYDRLVRVVAYCHRFTNNCRIAKQDRVQGTLKTSEIQSALLSIIRQVQSEAFRQEVTYLSQNKPLSKNSKILSLRPFIDKNLILRVGGRLSHSKFSYEKQHPIILPSKHQFTRLVFNHEHIHSLHAGPQQTLAIVRERYWPIHGRNIAKQVYRSCVKCFRLNPIQTAHVMGDLPEGRINASLPFTITGIDYCGPFIVKDRKGRGCKLTKAYVSVFVCFSTKCLHVELVSDLTTESFIAALKRFISRRGKPTKLYSDNGTNFVGAKNEVSALCDYLQQNQDTFSNFCAMQGIEWHFIPSHSPHFGGLWEAGVKSIKGHMKRVIGDTHLTYEELYTLIVQIEAILNSRPLTPLSSDPADLEPITPAHFLIGRTLISIPEPDFSQLKENTLSRYQLIQKMRQHIWQRWSVEYISELQTRCKWKQSQKHIEVNTLVLIKDNRLPPLKWLLGRVIQVHPGADGVPRVVTIKTSSGVIKRAVRTICPLPVEGEQKSDVQVQQASTI